MRLMGIGAISTPIEIMFTEFASLSLTAVNLRSWC